MSDDDYRCVVMNQLESSWITIDHGESPCVMVSDHELVRQFSGQKPLSKTVANPYPNRNWPQRLFVVSLTLILKWSQLLFEVFVYFGQNDRIVSKSKHRLLEQIVYFPRNDRIFKAMIAFFTCDPSNDVSLNVSNIYMCFQTKLMFPICKICFLSNSNISKYEWLNISKNMLIKNDRH